MSVPAPAHQPLCVSWGPSVNVTLHAWWLIAYLVIGAVLWLPLEWVAWSSTARPKDPFWSWLRRAVRRRPYVPVATVVAWPLALWELR